MFGSIQRNLFAEYGRQGEIGTTFISCHFIVLLTMFHNRLEYCSIVPMYWLQHESAGVSACSAAGGTSARTQRTSTSSQPSCDTWSHLLIKQSLE